MSTKTQDSIERLEVTLKWTRDRLRSDAEGMAESAAGLTSEAGTGDLSNAPMHLGDKGSEEFEHGMDMVLLGNEENLLQEVEAALDRIEGGTFGTCEACGEAIAPERLEAIPHTRYCVECAKTESEIPVPNFNDGRPRSLGDTLGGEGMGSSSLDVPVSADDESEPIRRHETDLAIGTPGGGTLSGGLAGSAEGHGDPDEEELEAEMGVGDFDPDDRDVDPVHRATSGPSGGAVGGSPANKRRRNKAK